jgi:hypothetical protein
MSFTIGLSECASCGDPRLIRSMPALAGSLPTGTTIASLQPPLLTVGGSMGAISTGVHVAPSADTSTETAPGRSPPFHSASNSKDEALFNLYSKLAGPVEARLTHSIPPSQSASVRFSVCESVDPQSSSASAVSSAPGTVAARTASDGGPTCPAKFAVTVY